jgi:RNA polymerase sigma-70 factor (subfamily 1)
MDAAKRLPEFLRKRSVPFYPWLRQIAWERLVDLHRRHIQAKARSVMREERFHMPLPDRSSIQLADRLVASGTNPSVRLVRQELRERVRAALKALPERDRELLVLIYMEQLSAREVGAVFGISEGAVNMRHLRAVERLRALLDEGPAG